MRRYRRLTPKERIQIEALKKSGISIRQMAKILGFSPSSICRELKRNPCPPVSRRTYRAACANRLSALRRKHVGPKKRIQPGSKLEQDVKAWLTQRQWSPEQISAHLKKQKVKLSADTIYRFVYADRKLKGSLYRHLRRRHRFRMTRAFQKSFKNIGKRTNQKGIAERPAVVEKRIRWGDLERDTVLGKRPGPVLLTIVDRVTRVVRMRKLNQLNAHLTHQATVKLLRSMPRQARQTMTNDNGPEFALHAQTTQALRMPIYFNDPYSSWQRGTNENTNGLIRQYFPKGFDFNSVSHQYIKKVENLLNSRPRKCLGFKTPAEVEKALQSRVLH